MKNEKEFLDELEEKVGRKLTGEEKEHALKDNERISKVLAATGAKPVSLFSIFVARHMLTAIVAVLLCLSVVLPLTLIRPGDNDSLSITDPPVSRPTWYSNQRIMLIDESQLNTLDMLLLFESDIFWVSGMMEISTTTPTILGYVFNAVISTQDNLTDMTKRIRTYKRHAFRGFFVTFYATLEQAHNTHVSSLANEDKIYQFSQSVVDDPLTISSVPQKINIYAFLKDDLAVFAYVGPDTAQIYFVHNGLEYFIELREMDVVITIDFIKNVFMATLLNQN